MSENAPSFQSVLASVLANAVVIVTTTTVEFVRAVILALPELKDITLPTSVDNHPEPPFIPAVALAVIFTPVPVPADAGVKVVVVVFSDK